MKRIFCICLLIVALAGCHKENPQPTPRPPWPPDPNPKVFVMYDNIMDWFKADADEAASAVAAGALAEGQRVIVFQRPQGRSSVSPFYPNAVIYELRQNSSSSTGYEKVVLKQYNGDLPLSVSNMQQVISDIRGFAPTAEHFGFAFGSHGMGWVPKSYSGGFNRTAPRGGEDGLPADLQPFAELWAPPSDDDMTRFFQSEIGENFDVGEFVTALSGGGIKWDFVILDDCFMSSVEALYDMRSIADYIISSPTEIMADGFPYDRVINTIFRNWSESGFIATAAGFVNYYLTVSSPRYGYVPYATISVTKTSELPALAASVRAIAQFTGGHNTVDPIVSGIQSYEGLNTHIFWDLDDYIGHFSRDPALYGEFGSQMQKTVVYSGRTPEFYSDMTNKGPKPITHFSGLAVFIPWAGTSGLQSFYEQTAWYKAVFN